MPSSETDYAFLRKLVLDRTAKRIDPPRDALFETKLTPLARDAGADDLKGLIELLRVDPTTHLHRAVAEAMTTNETSFYRDLHPYEMLRNKAIPELIAQKAKERRLRIWSAACSTGQEAYSVAMLILEHFPVLKRWDVKVVGTDISRTVLEYAAHGCFRRMEVNRGLPAAMLVKYFQRSGEQWQIAEEVRALCDFRQINLRLPLSQKEEFDIVLLRNVLLYFPEEDRARVFSEVHRQMNPRGFLLLGNSEQAEDFTDRFEVEFTADTYFYRPKAPTS